MPAPRENRTMEGSPHAHEWRGESRARGSEATAGNVSDEECGSWADPENGMRREGGPPRLAAVPSREPFKPSKPISQCRREMASPASAETLSQIVSWSRPHRASGSPSQEPVNKPRAPPPRPLLTRRPRLQWAEQEARAVGAQGVVERRARHIDGQAQGRAVAVGLTPLRARAAGGEGARGARLALRVLAGGA